MSYLYTSSSPVGIIRLYNHTVSGVLGTEPIASGMLCRHSTSRATLPGLKKQNEELFDL